MKAFFLSLAAALALVGCGSSSDKPTSMASSDQQVEDMVAARKLFDESADKNYDSLPSDKKAQYTKLVHATDEAGAKRWWSQMTNPNGSAGSASAGR